MSKLVEHLRERGCDPEKYSVLLDEEEMVATFLLYTLTGKMVGFQQYRPGKEKNVAVAREQFGKDLDLRQLRYYTSVRDKEQCFFGFEQLDWRNGPIFVVEGIFDAIRLHNIGRNAIAVFGNNPIYLPTYRRALPHEFIAVCDDDPAPENPDQTAPGKMLAWYTDRYIVCPTGKDPGDMTDAEIEEFINHVLG
jgi:hypothetical protein